jgi:hypothetical protein
VSQLDRIRAREQALAHGDELAEQIKSCGATDAEKSRMVDLLSALWLQADKACGGPETRP